MIDEDKKEKFGNWYIKIDESNDLLDNAISKLIYFLDGTNGEDAAQTTAQSAITRDMLESVINRNKSFAMQVDNLVLRLIELF